MPASVGPVRFPTSTLDSSFFLPSLPPSLFITIVNMQPPSPFATPPSFRGFAHLPNEISWRIIDLACQMPLAAHGHNNASSPAALDVSAVLNLMLVSRHLYPPLAEKLYDLHHQRFMLTAVRASLSTCPRPLHPKSSPWPRRQSAKRLVSSLHRTKRPAGQGNTDNVPRYLAWSPGGG